MSKDTRPTKELFRLWRGGDGAAGQIMAQRFADWYYAIATSRLGERAGREPCEKACQRFGEGVVNQTDAKQLVKWAHDLIAVELAGRGARASDGDEATAHTGNQRPKALLVKAREAHPAELELLAEVYRGGDAARMSALAEPFGGMPLGALRARYVVKAWLRDHGQVPFAITPTEPNLDLAPLPIYESGRMASAAEEANFEQWMLSDIDLCKDIAEFAQFAIALRGGLPAPAAAPTPKPAVNAADAPPAAASGASPLPMIVGGLVVVGLLLVLVAAVAAVMFLGVAS
jgi:hypothetical protein